MASYAATTRFALIVALAFVVALVHPAAAARAEGAGPRLALVIGNASYRNVTPLANPVNDARLMSRRLDEAGFAVTTVTEADRRAMVEAVERFGRAVRAAGPDTLALFYFAGHGVRSDGFNFLVPLGVDIRAEADIARETVAAEWVLERLQAPGATSVMVLDACRDNPFDRGQRAIPDIGDGLARMTARRGDIIAYATGPGDVALDGAGANSPYTTALARLI
ncbi:MAG: caspase family protein, partial [Pseudomonadota bacterium]